MMATIKEILPLLELYYPDNVTGGSLHIVLEDGNINDGSVEYCKRYAIESGDTSGQLIADALLGMTKTQRQKICYLWSRIGV